MRTGEGLSVAFGSERYTLLRIDRGQPDTGAMQNF